MDDELTYRSDVYENEWDRIVVFDGLCKSCGLCVVECPPRCLYWSETKLGVYGTPVPECNIDACTGCKLCEVLCPDTAIFYERLKKKPKEKAEKVGVKEK